MATTITLTSPSAYQVFQRNSLGEADIRITGTYTGTVPASVEAQWGVGGWSVIDAAPEGGTFSGTLAGQVAGQGTLAVRDSGNTGVADSAAYVGIGDVFGVAGQSNASGRGANHQSYNHATLKAGMFRQDGQWRELADPSDIETHGVTPRGSAWPLLATRIMADQGVPVAFVTAPKGGSGLANSTAEWNKLIGTYPAYNIFLDTVMQSGVNELKAILWYQGEEEAADNPATRSAYLTAINQLIANFRADLGWDNLPLMAAQPGHQANRTQTRGTINGVRLAIMDAWEKNSAIYAGPLTYDVDLSDAGGDSIHFITNAELTTLADRWWRNLEFVFYSGTDGRAPKVSSVTLASANSALVNFTVDVAPLINAGTGGWRITDNNGVLSISSAVIQADTVSVVVTASTNFVGQAYLSYASGNDGVGATMTDSGTIPFPPEPIVDALIVHPAAAAVWYW